ncbi:Fe-S cluster assembly scaffold protein NifU [candidate division WOR-3 bacterium RBG_13_43_14]|uniref:Fe-S cluster assembly scaffold protein NifU n=1 Tax=candidate division WOR-3 bacterium RBG_13_43_14 TaxID=1802590 RepID=A0A1F4UAZ5_UNCW3|nr:MAG: Fe-S cluster assembly scaffold protein NifU [candidate division WOR-3 bacterium RBG_13_43_14]
MKSTEYSEKVLDHFRNPRNTGTLEGDDIAVGRVGNPVCGDLMEIYLKIKNDRIEDVKFKTFGCGSAIATASMITELAKGKTLEEAIKITRQDVANELDGLPPIKMHCSNLAADALRDAIDNYRKKQQPSTKRDTADIECPDKIKNREKFTNNGVFYTINNEQLTGKRVIIVDTGISSAQAATTLKGISPRIIFLTRKKESETNPEMLKQLNEAGVKMLFESEIIEFDGLKSLEKVRIHDLNENEEYDLFTDAVIIFCS